MESSVVHVKVPRRSTAYDIEVGAGMLEGAGEWARGCLGEQCRKLLIVTNRRVENLHSKTLLDSLRYAGFATHIHLIGDGERFKNIRTLEQTLATLGEHAFARTDAVVALGGGVVGDLAGFAASIYLRGIDFLQIPTTLLSMIDSSVGGKTGINTSFGKNLTGSFYQPRGVLIDVETLRTLPRRELTAGFCEAIKQGAISSKRLFQQTDDFLRRHAKTRRTKEANPSELIDLIAEQIRFKASIVQNDEKEAVANTSSRSRKILNFGHTFAHALEKTTDYKYLKHGEAVGYGIMFAAALSKKLELVGQDEVNSLNDVVHRAGVLPAIGHIDPSEVSKAFKHDKKQIGDSLHWILLRGIGKPVIVPGSDIPKSAIASTLKAIIRK